MDRTSPLSWRRTSAWTIGRRGSVLAGLVLAVSLVAGCDGRDSTDGGVDIPAESVDPPAEGALAEGANWRAVDVVDGDTLGVAGPDGELTVRIVGVNTPEVDECLYDEATDALAALVEGEELVLVRDESDVDRFG